MLDWMMAIGQILVGVVGLVLGGDMLVRGADRFARKLGVSAMVVALTVVAMGTSMPELVVSIYSLFKDLPGITVGNAIGSNLFNLLPALGIVALVRPIDAKAAYIYREFPIMLGVMALTWAFCWNGTLSWPQAAVLLLLLVGYLVLMVQLAKRERNMPAPELEELEADTAALDRPLWYHFLFMAVGFGVMVGGSHFFVNGSVWVAEWFGVPAYIIGLTLVAGGTSLPELFTSLLAVLRGKADIAVGNVVGSCIFNMLAILGSAGVLRSGVKIEASMLPLWPPGDILIMVVAGLLAWAAFLTNKRLGRWEGGVLTASYIAYLVYRIHSEAPGASAAG